MQARIASTKRTRDRQSYKLQKAYVNRREDPRDIFDSQIERVRKSANILHAWSETTGRNLAPLVGLLRKQRSSSMVVGAIQALLQACSTITEQSSPRRQQSVGGFRIQTGPSLNNSADASPARPCFESLKRITPWGELGDEEIPVLE